MNVLVTGSSSGIGETIARTLVEAGHQVVLMARCPDRIVSLAKELNGEGAVWVWHVAEPLIVRYLTMFSNF